MTSDNPSADIGTASVRNALVQLLLSPDIQASSEATRGTGGESEAVGYWNQDLACAQIMKLAMRWRVVPHLEERLQQCEIPLPPAAKQALRRSFLGAFGRTRIGISKALAASKALEQEAIPTAIFKGVASIVYLYQDPRRRAIYDVDLMILPQDLERSLTCLETIGFRRKDGQAIRDYVRFVENAPGFAGNRAVALADDRGNELDLHWGLASSGMTVEDLLSRRMTVPAPGGGDALPLVAPADSFLLTVHHSVRENLAPEGMIRDILDIRLWCDWLARKQMLDEVMRQCAGAGLAAAVLALLSILRSYGNEGAVTAGITALEPHCSRRETAAAESLAELFREQLTDGPIDKDLFHLVHAQPWKQVLRGIKGGWAGYRNTMRDVERQLEQERSLGERAMDLAKSLPARRRLRMARELALLKYRTESAG